MFLLGVVFHRALGLARTSFAVSAGATFPVSAQAPAFASVSSAVRATPSGASASASAPATTSTSASPATASARAPAPAGAPVSAVLGFQADAVAIKFGVIEFAQSLFIVVTASVFNHTVFLPLLNPNVREPDTASFPGKILQILPASARRHIGDDQAITAASAPKVGHAGVSEGKDRGTQTYRIEERMERRKSETRRQKTDNDS